MAFKRCSCLSSASAAATGFLVNTCVAVTLFRWGRELDVDDPAEADLVRLAARMVAQATGLMAGVALVGLVGLLKGNAGLVRFFVRFSILDFIGTAILLASTLVLVLSPSIAAPFADLLCRELTRGEFFRATTEREGRAGGAPTGWGGLRGVDAVVWGVETCEDSWQVGACMFAVLVACVLVAKGWGMWATWEFYSTVDEQEAQHVDDAEWDVEKPAARTPSPRGTRPRSSSSSTSSKPSCTRSLPVESHPHFHGRFKSHSVSHREHRPRLVLVPVFFDRSGPRSISPSTYSSPTDSSSGTAFTTASSSPTRPPRHSRRYSAPSPPAEPPSYHTTPPTPTSPTFYPFPGPVPPVSEDPDTDWSLESRRSRPRRGSSRSLPKPDPSESRHQD